MTYFYPYEDKERFSIIKKGDTVRYPPFIMTGVPETIRTSGPFLRREVLYPAELRGQKNNYTYTCRNCNVIWLATGNCKYFRT